MYGRVVQRPKSLDIGKQERVSSLLSKQLKLSAIISEITTCLTTTKDGLGQVFEGSEPTCALWLTMSCALIPRYYILT